MDEGEGEGEGEGESDAMIRKYVSKLRLIGVQRITADLRDLYAVDECGYSLALCMMYERCDDGDQQCKAANVKLHDIPD